ncbi:MAG: ABC transporter permease [Anaerolineae bacterium]|nr:ABC transporter permease [Anaerolineae bacterium]
MRQFIIRRLLQAIPTLFGITLFSYLLMLAAPGDPIQMIGFNPDLDPQAMQVLRRQLGMDQPAIVQYVYWLIGNDWVHIDADGDGAGDYVDVDGDEIKETPLMGKRQGMLRGDMGLSIQYKQPVWDVIMSRVPKTLQLTLTALVVGYLIGIPIGVYSAVKHNGVFDQAARVLAVVGNAVPGFWLALILVMVFAVNLRWLPTGGTRTLGGTNDLWDQVKHMILPVTVLALGTIAGLSRIMRTETLEVLGQDYIRTARAKGLSNTKVWWAHAVRNALIPLATFIGPALGGLLGGAVITETIFSWPGMGRLGINAVFQRDYPLIMGEVVIGAILYILGLLVSDILYAWVDPRIRLR